MVKEAYKQIAKHPTISISFIIQPSRTDIHDEFEKQIDSSKDSRESLNTKMLSANIGSSTLGVVTGDITSERVSRNRTIT